MNFFFEQLSALEGHATDRIPPHAHFKRHVKDDRVAKWATGISVGAPPLALPPGAACLCTRWTWTRRWPVKAGFTVSLSPARKSAGDSPVLVAFHFSPLTFNFIYGPDFCYISFDLVRLGPSIAINSMLMFHSSPISFNFRIKFKKINLFGTEV